MRLIDADASVESIKNLLANGATVEQAIDAQPTAYDLVTVVDCIDNVTQDLNVVEVLSHFNPDKTIQKPLENFLNSFKAEICRIVRAGGRE